MCTMLNVSQYRNLQVQCIIYWTLLKYLRSWKIHLYLYCNVDKTINILMRLIIVVKMCVF